MSHPLQNVNNSFFEGVYKDVWKYIIPPGLTEAEADFITEIASLKKNDPVLDLMCGYGRHSIELARRGMKVTAIDNQEEYITEIKKAAGKEGLSVDAFKGDIQQTELHGTYKAVICMGNSFAFFDRNGAAALLKKISAHLQAGGVFIVNSWSIAEIVIRHFKEKDWHYAGPYKCILEFNYLFHPSRVEFIQTVIGPDGSTETQKGIDYIFTLDELETLFNQAGMQTSGLYSTPRKKKFSLGDSRIYLVATKID